MAIFISDISACEYWFGDQPTIRTARPLACVPGFSAACHAVGSAPWEELERLGFCSDGCGPLHVDVPMRRMTARNNALKTHVWSTPPAGTFVRLSDDVYVEAPIASLVRCSRLLTDGELAKYLYQALGAFRVCRGRTVDAPPLTTMEDALRYLAGAGSVRGACRLRELLAYVAPGAASVRECEVGVLLCLPARLGGRGLPLPKLNHRIESRVSALGIVRYADFCWVLVRLILEYDSREFHADAEKIGLDSARRAQLQLEGYEVVTLTNYQLKRRAEFEDVVRKLQRELGVKAQTSRFTDFAEREARLRRSVLGIDWLG